MPQQEDTQMSFWQHLEALRWVLMRIVIVYFILVGICFAAMPHIFNSVILGPTSSDFILYRWLSGLGGDGTFFPDFSGEFKVDIINVKLASQFITHITTSFCLAFLLIFPYLVITCRILMGVFGKFVGKLSTQNW